MFSADRNRRYRAAHPEYRERERERHAKWRCTTAGILAEERHYQKRVRGTADVPQD